MLHLHFNKVFSAFQTWSHGAILPRLEARSENTTLALDRAIAGFLVRSSFNISYLVPWKRWIQFDLIWFYGLVMVFLMAMVISMVILGPQCSCVDVWNRTSWIFLTLVCQTTRVKQSRKQIGEFCSHFFWRSWSGLIQDADVDEPLAENYVHVAVAVAQNLYADASGPLMYFAMNWFAFRQEVEESHAVLCCLAVGVGKSLFVFWLCCHCRHPNLPLMMFHCFQSQNDWGRSQQCTSQDKLCLFATWLEVLTIVAMVNEMRA